MKYEMINNEEALPFSVLHERSLIASCQWIIPVVVSTLMSFSIHHR